MQRLLTTVVLVGLLVATAAAFAVTERLKLTKSPVYGTLVTPKFGFSPTCGCARGKATIRVKLRRSDDVTVSVLNRHRQVVRELASLRASRGVNVFRWDGRTDANVIAPDGLYKAEIRLAGQHQTIVLPNTIQLDTKPPAVVSVTLNRDTFSPDGDLQADFVRIDYELSKSAHAMLYLNDTRVLRTYRRPAHGSFSWFGNVDGKVLAPGWYTLHLGAVDAAGNSTPVKDRWRIHVRVRYIALASRHIVARAGERFSIGVSTDAKQYTWKLGRRKSVATGPLLRLLASTRRGRYTLTVAERGHVARATVIVR